MRQTPDRLAKLRELAILDTAPERVYDDMTRLLARTFDVPIALVNLLDADRDWFKSTVGLPLTESPVATSFCEVILGTSLDLIVVPDTTADSRFSAHPLVVGEPFVRFYAAARLVVDNETVGTLCAYDLKPREIARAKLEKLESLAKAAMQSLRKRLARRP